MQRQSARPGDRIESELNTERKEILRDTLESPGWTAVIRPALALKMDRIARTLAANDQRSLEETRVYQGRYRALQEILSITIDDVGLLFED